MRSWVRAAGLVGAGLVAAALSGGAQAQMPAYPAPAYPPPPPAEAAVAAPPASPEAAEIASCLCLRRQLDALGAAMTTRRQAYDASKQRVGRLDAQMQSERATMDVNNPAAVAQFRQLLMQRDAEFRRSSGPLVTELTRAVQRYNGVTNNYNARCANRPWSPIVLSQVQATLSCPAP